MDAETAWILAQWRALDQVLFWVNTQEEKMLSKGDLYDAVMGMRPEPFPPNAAAAPPQQRDALGGLA